MELHPHQFSPGEGEVGLVLGVEVEAHLGPQGVQPPPPLTSLTPRLWDGESHMARGLHHLPAMALFYLNLAVY